MALQLGCCHTLPNFFNHKICEYTLISMFALTIFSFHIFLVYFYFVHITREDKYIIMYCIFIFALCTGRLLSNKFVERICHDTKCVDTVGKQNKL